MDRDLNSMGITGLADLRGRNAAAMTRDYRDRADHPFDPALHACFAAIVQFAETGEARPWWFFLSDDARTVLRAK